jgi:hypothetical protein
MPQNDTGVWGARFYNASQKAVPTPAPGTPASPYTGPTCPGSNATIFNANNGASYMIECFVDHVNFDLPVNPVFVDNFAECIQACDDNDDCVDVSLSGVACYLKSAVGETLSNQVIWGARLLPAPSSSTLYKRAVATAHHPQINTAVKRTTAADGGISTVESPCNGQCSGWGGPDTTFLPLPNVTTTQSDIVYVIRAISKHRFWTSQLTSLQHRHAIDNN